MMIQKQESTLYLNGKIIYMIEVVDVAARSYRVIGCGLDLMIWQQSDQNLRLNGTMPEMES